MRDPVLRLVPRVGTRGRCVQAPQPARDHPGKPGPGVKPAAAGLKKVCWGLDKPRQPRGGRKGVLDGAGVWPGGVVGRGLGAGGVGGGGGGGVSCLGSGTGWIVFFCRL